MIVNTYCTREDCEVKCAKYWINKAGNPKCMGEYETDFEDMSNECGKYQKKEFNVRVKI